MSNVDINVDRRTDGLTDGRTENRTPISHPATSRCDNKKIRTRQEEITEMLKQKKTYIWTPLGPPRARASGTNRLILKIQSNLDSSSTDGSFTMANSNSFLSPYEVLPIAQENKYLSKSSYCIVKLYVVCTH